jgi:hypothetical protein
MIFVFPLATDWRSCLGIEKVNTAFVSTTSGEYVFGGGREMLTMLRSWTIIRRQRYE